MIKVSFSSGVPMLARVIDVRPAAKHGCAVRDESQSVQRKGINVMQFSRRTV